MPQPAKGARLGGSPAHERIILANLASQLFEHGKIVTTEAKAKRLRPVAEKLITKAKRGDIHARREVLKTVRDKGVVHVLFTEIAPTFDRPPGWLHPDHQGRSPQGRQRPDGADRARHRACRGQDVDRGPGRCGVGHRSGLRVEPGLAGERRQPGLAGQPLRDRESPATELVEGTEERDEAVSDQETPSDDSSTEEAASGDKA